MEVVPSARYRNDLDNIVEHIAKQNPAVAVQVWDAVEKQVAQLEEFPLLGRAGRVPGTRELVIARTPYIVVYSANGIVILLRLLHGAERWPPTGSNPLK